ncbi:hypothetical protein ACLOJK_014705 [Asimina triloba]
MFEWDSPCINPCYGIQIDALPIVGLEVGVSSDCCLIVEWATPRWTVQDGIGLLPLLAMRSARFRSWLMVVVLSMGMARGVAGGRTLRCAGHGGCCPTLLECLSGSRSLCSMGLDWVVDWGLVLDAVGRGGVLVAGDLLDAFERGWMNGMPYAVARTDGGR